MPALGACGPCCRAFRRSSARERRCLVAKGWFESAVYLEMLERGKVDFRLLHAEGSSLRRTARHPPYPVAVTSLKHTLSRLTICSLAKQGSRVATPGSLVLPAGKATRTSTASPLPLRLFPLHQSCRTHHVSCLAGMQALQLPQQSPGADCTPLTLISPARLLCRIETKLTKALGIKRPIVQGGMMCVHLAQHRSEVQADLSASSLQVGGAAEACRCRLQRRRTGHFDGLDCWLARGAAQVDP